jgi:hypothetical protein
VTPVAIQKACNQREALQPPPKTLGNYSLVALVLILIHQYNLIYNYSSYIQQITRFHLGYSVAAKHILPQ